MASVLEDPVDAFYVDKQSVFGSPLCYSCKFSTIFFLTLALVLLFQTLTLINLAHVRFGKTVSWAIVFIPIYIIVLSLYIYAWFNTCCCTMRSNVGRRIDSFLKNDGR